MYSFVSLWVPSYFNTQTFSVFGCMFGQRVGPVDPITCQNYLHLGPKPGSDELAQTVGPRRGGLDKEPFTLTELKTHECYLFPDTRSVRYQVWGDPVMLGHDGSFTNQSLF